MTNNFEDYRQGIIDWVESENETINSPVAKGRSFCQWCLENIFDLSNLANVTLESCNRL